MCTLKSGFFEILEIGMIARIFFGIKLLWENLFRFFVVGENGIEVDFVMHRKSWDDLMTYKEYLDDCVTHKFALRTFLENFFQTKSPLESSLFLSSH